MPCAYIEETQVSLLSSEDRTNLAFVSPSKIQEWTLAKIEDYTNRIEALKAVHNSAAAINRKLPRDVLLEVFSQLKPDRRSAGWYDVLHVCRLWRLLLFRCPAFWTDVLRAPRDLVGVTERSMARLTHFLDLARTRPLELSVIGLPQSAARALSSHARHIVVLEVEGNQRDLALLNSLIDAGLPLLKRLSVAHRCDTRNTRALPPIQLGYDKLPCLRSLKMPSQSSYIMSHTFARLSHIELYGCRCRSCQASSVTYSHMRYTLGRCSALETLELTDLCLKDLPSCGGYDTVRLPSLRRLDVWDDPGLMPALLADLSLPKTCFVSLNRAATTFESMLPEPEDCPQFYPVKFADKVVVEFDAEEYATLRTYAKDSQLLHMESPGPFRSEGPMPSFSGCESSFFQLVLQVADIFAPPNDVTALTLRTAPPLGDTIGTHSVALRKLLGAFPRLFCLDTTAYDGKTDLLSTLGEVLDIGLYHCPFLLELRVRWRYQIINPNRDSHWLSPKVPYVPRRTGPQALGDFCDAIASIIKRRAGRAGPLCTLSVTIVPGDDDELPWTELAKRAEARLQEELGFTKLVHRIDVSYATDAS
ncbi:hypothetical protein L226DRAFT_614135 [Lentinus tigrinus ALCF2SS1-7]|uniref:Uncharacterized protein n=1 Tax=Lentinus tigrinus ALCF2SS1-6 TaxID=1328759 RepID=A0A5C2SD74_9APHY|nr:hypothetical protein L227DRAFT_654302 [Lentinus tigrinus ALCF2SS1-6]RPD73642.1 hypothetical protein L226DRAFT_614135 [Lentinus tigrinus ALCF2SS1-7]